MAAYGLAGDGTPLTVAQRPRCCAKTRVGHPCRNKVLPGMRRCKFHGGMSSGPKTPAGRARIAAAQRLRWAIFRNEPYPAFIDPYRDADEEIGGRLFPFDLMALLEAFGGIAIGSALMGNSVTGTGPGP